jgi:predicted transcriptional regulator of viral defense system
MKWDDFLDHTRDRMVIESDFLHLLYPNKNQVRLQLSRWHKQGKLLQLKRGYYLLPEKHRSQKIFEPYIAAILKSPSYISLEKALEMHHLIPEAVYTFTSVTTKDRPEEFVNAVGRFRYVSIKPDYFWGYRPISQGPYTGYLAEPEKALIDLFYFQRQRVGEEFIAALRLQNTDTLSPQKLKNHAQKMKLPFIKSAVDLLLSSLEKS